MTRLEFNLKILEQIKQFIEGNPDQRFNQALVNLGFGYCRDNYHVESSDSLDSVNYRIDILKEKG